MKTSKTEGYISAVAGKKLFGYYWHHLTDQKQHIPISYNIIV